MKTPSNRIHKLLLKYRKNQCTRKEYEEFIQLCQQSGNELVVEEIMQKDWVGEQKEIPHKPEISLQPKRRTWLIGLKVAATLALLIAAGFVLYNWLAEEPVSYVTGNGEVVEITLPDGSEVTLNANSNLTWVPAEKESDNRLVELSGEAFFEVAKEKLASNNQKEYRGFQVRTPKMTVHVLGTSFNIAAREKNTEVFLEEGSVELQLPDQVESARRMIPGDKVILDNRTGEVTERKSEQISTSASWVTGILNYHDKSLKDVLQNLSELFGVHIICEDPKLQAKQINLGVPYMDWENTQRAIEVEFKKEGGEYKVIQTSNQNNQTEN